MHELYDLKEMLCKELEEYGRKDEMTAGSLEIIDKLAHAVKNIDKIIESYEEEEYSSRASYMDGNMGGRNSYRGGSYYSRGGSYARGRGSNAKRDSRGRYSSREGGYSRTGDMIEQLNEMYEDAPNEQTRQEIKRLMDKMEGMM